MNENTAPESPENKVNSDKSEVDNARLAALEILGAVLSRKQALDLTLAESEAFKSLSSRDRGFCRMLATTTIRYLGQINDLIARAEDRPASKSPTLENILRLGVTQILFMDVPDHAAVDTCVRLAEAKGMDRQKGFVNGLLRTITRSGRTWKDKQDPARLNTPEWLLKTWIEDYGFKEAAMIAQANLAEAPFDISIKNENERNHWAASFKASQIGAGTLRCPAGEKGTGPVSDRPGFDEGAWWVQDVSAALAAHLLGDVEGRRVFDLCAAPGGKTLQLAAMGAHVTALDRSAKRLKKLEENLERMQLGANVKIEVADATAWRPKEQAEVILLDAPCTATGTIRRHPDVALLKTPADMQRLTNVQENILENAFQMLAPRGILVYCTCSLQKAEGEAQIENLLARHSNAVRVPIIPEDIGGLEEPITAAGDLRILPYHLATLGGMDGFYIARLTKV